MRARPSDPAVWDALRAICTGLPDVSEKVSHGELAWSAGAGRKARQFATTWDHHHDDRNAVVMAAPPGAQEQLVASNPARYFRPPYVGSKGWIGIYLDSGPIDWDLVEMHLTDAHALIAAG
ncbi:MAG TPA: MmcQ/YjbR family DNA-binding protein [Ilumatobacter sp.]|nr:MmcQ/YjbR family DNA-binding protein [Ilumatobacter sp.]